MERNREKSTPNSAVMLIEWRKQFTLAFHEKKNNPFFEEKFKYELTNMYNIYFLQ